MAGFEEKITEREQYAFVRTPLGQNRSKTGRAGKSAERFACRAQAGKVRCPSCRGRGLQALVEPTETP